MEQRHTIRIHYHGTAENPVPTLFENSKAETPEPLTHLHPHFYSGNLACFHCCECCQCAIVANTNVSNYQLDFGKNVGDIGFVECGKSEAFLAEILQRRADQIKFLVFNDQKSVMECLACLD